MTWEALNINVIKPFQVTQHDEEARHAQRDRSKAGSTAQNGRRPVAENRT